MWTTGGHPAFDRLASVGLPATNLAFDKSLAQSAQPLSVRSADLFVLARGSRVVVSRLSTAYVSAETLEHSSLDRRAAQQSGCGVRPEAGETVTDFRVGTSGFSYKEWKGNFYPSEVKEKQFLEYYSSRLPTVEINNTFYRLPRAELLASWASRVPTEFTFAVKASRRITHFARLRDAEEPTAALLDALQPLEQRLGAVLFQLPPNLASDLSLLRDFLQFLDGRARSAFEFRHESWFDDATLSLLKEYGAALVFGDPDAKAPRAPVELTAKFAYVRLRQDDYTEAELSVWAKTLGSLPADQVFVYFKHEVLAPDFAQKLGAKLRSG